MCADGIGLRQRGGAVGERHGLKQRLPAGVPPPGATGVTVAVTPRLWPNTPVVAPLRAVVVDAEFTLSTTGAAVLVRKSVAPA